MIKTYFIYHNLNWRTGLHSSIKSSSFIKEVKMGRKYKTKLQDAWNHKWLTLKIEWELCTSQGNLCIVRKGIYGGRRLQNWGKPFSLFIYSPSTDHTVWRYNNLLNWYSPTHPQFISQLNNLKFLFFYVKYRKGPLDSF